MPIAIDIEACFFPNRDQQEIASCRPGDLADRIKVIFDECQAFNGGNDMTAARERGKKRAWQRMLSGRRLDLLDPSPLDVEIEDIAVGLARVARWNGQTSGDWAFSVAQHCLLVEDLLMRFREDVPRSWRRFALLHDAPEYVVGDLITPFKNALNSDYREIEQRLMQAIRQRFGLTGLPRSAAILIKRADRAAAYIEAIRIAGFPPKEANPIFDPRGQFRALDLNAIDLTPLPPNEAEHRYLHRYQSLMEAS